ncbi:MAG: UDP-N-acetylmuramoyl-L-alanine--D-glutamate ligase [Elusimicrobia bacterium]|nr:UDP-N-acetylmuramoyl-L-alanine--D-glutamate ligase [Elusimicrobiota bacterium]
MKKLKGRRVLVFGLGKSGLSAINLLKSQGADVVGYDEKPYAEIKNIPPKICLLEENLILEDKLEKYDLVVVSPGIPPHNKLIESLALKKFPIISELELGLSLLPEGVRIVAVTGTNGKTTTSELISFLTGGQTAGNIGRPLTGVLGSLSKEDILVLEVSSFQLHFSPGLKPDVGVLLNLFPEHTDWHRGYLNYRKSKFSFFKRMIEASHVVYNASSPEIDSFVKKLKPIKIPFSSEIKLEDGIFTENNQVILRLKGEEKKYLHDKEVLPGKHNLENLMAALGAAAALGVKELPLLDDFRLSPHRMEYFSYGGLTFINDSKATNFNSTFRALESIDESLILLMGGKSKGESEPRLRGEAAKKARCVIAFGESRKEIEEIFSGALPVKVFISLREAVEEAVRLASKDTKILLSPGGSSYDEFEDYEVRGNKFKEWAEEFTTKAINRA